jgi:predicted DNA-binding transcriptional regulator YafY
VVNPELKMRILSNGSNVKVLEPASLQEYVLAEAKLMATAK